MKVVIVDDHPLVLQGLSSVLRSEEGVELVGQAVTGDEAVTIVAGQRPDMVIIDLRLGRDYGLDVVKRIRETGIECRFVALTSSASIKDFKKAGKMSLDGYLSKDAPPEEFLAAIRLIMKGRKFFDPVLVETFMNNEKKNPLHELTHREREVLGYLSKGLNNKAIAQKIFVTEYTVKKHVGQILEKLGLSDRTQAALYAVNHSSDLS